MKIKIFIDQGHNPDGYNTGAEGNGLFEQNITYDVGTRLSKLLLANGNFETKLSRTSKTQVIGTSNASSLRDRVRAANNWGADVFLSIHTNAAENKQATGSEALIYSKKAKASFNLATDILEQLNLTTGLRNRGILERPSFYVLKRTNMPAVLVELGFITNKTDADLMANSPDLFSKGIYRGILKYYDLG